MSKNVSKFKYHFSVNIILLNLIVKTIQRLFHQTLKLNNKLIFLFKLHTIAQ